jgi:hypothetical protein
MRAFTREEFYELVWSKPMTTLAKEFGLSDVALHKVCRKHEIPNPPLGWWAKKAAGKEPSVLPLPELLHLDVGTVVIAAGIVRDEPAWLADVRENARLIASTETCIPDGAFHPIVARTIAALRKAKSAEKGLIGVAGPNAIECLLGPPSIDRLEAILPRIVAAAQAQGFELVSGKERAQFDNGRAHVGFVISETYRRVKHVLTPAETAEIKKSEREARGLDWREAFMLPTVQVPEWDYHPTGLLSFEMKREFYADHASVRLSFRDAKVQRLENVAPDIGVAIAVLAASQAECRKQATLEAQRRENEQERRAKAERARHIEERRKAELGMILDEVAATERLRTLLCSLRPEVADEPASRVSTFTDWAERHLVEREQALSAAGLAARLESKRLFGEDDDHALRPSHSYR